MTKKKGRERFAHSGIYDEAVLAARIAKATAAKKDSYGEILEEFLFGPDDRVEGDGIKMKKHSRASPTLPIDKINRRLAKPKMTTIIYGHPRIGRLTVSIDKLQPPGPPAKGFAYR